MRRRPGTIAEDQERRCRCQRMYMNMTYNMYTHVHAHVYMLLHVGTLGSSPAYAVFRKPTGGRICRLVLFACRVLRVAFDKRLRGSFAKACFTPPRPSHHVFLHTNKGRSRTHIDLHVEQRTSAVCWRRTPLSHGMRGDAALTMCAAAMVIGATAACLCVAPSARCCSAAPE
jgi:hypothetical protein